MFSQVARKVATPVVRRTFAADAKIVAKRSDPKLGYHHAERLVGK